MCMWVHLNTWSSGGGRSSRQTGVFVSVSTKRYCAPRLKTRANCKRSIAYSKGRENSTSFQTPSCLLTSMRKEGGGGSEAAILKCLSKISREWRENLLYCSVMGGGLQQHPSFCLSAKWRTLSRIRRQAMTRRLSPATVTWRLSPPRQCSC